jgi:hypothetical protein
VVLHIERVIATLIELLPLKSATAAIHVTTVLLTSAEVGLVECVEYEQSQIIVENTADVFSSHIKWSY